MENGELQEQNAAHFEWDGVGNHAPVVPRPLILLAA